MNIFVWRLCYCHLSTKSAWTLSILEIFLAIHGKVVGLILQQSANSTQFLAADNKNICIMNQLCFEGVGLMQKLDLFHKRMY